MAGKGDRKRPVDRKKFDENHDQIKWASQDKPKEKPKDD